MIALILAYYCTSSLTSCLTKQVLVAYPRPVTVSLVQQAFAAAGGITQVASVENALGECRAVMPVTLTLLASTVLYRISLVFNTLSFSQAVKTLQPLFAALLSRMLLGERSSTRCMLSLLLLLAGVTVATHTELSFSTLGFVCTVSACFFQALQAVLSKALLVRKQLSPEDLFAAAAVYTLAMLIPLWIVIDVPLIAAADSPGLFGSGAALLLLLNGASSFAAQSLSFALLCAVTSPVSAAVVSSFKRVVTIGVALLWFRNQITLPHIGGISLAVLGVALFQQGSHASSASTTREASEAADDAMPLLWQQPRRGARETTTASRSASAHRSPSCRGAV